ncbi:MAG: beta-lactamase family protein [Clostridia bacterium]|nr:beta-lactamase family protein [Clostridia bacterium]
MSFDAIVHRLSELDANLYDFALWTPGGIRSHRFQPCSRCLNSYSVAKAFIMTAVGLLYDDGRLSPSDFFARHFPQLKQHPQLGWRIAQVDHALTHRLGWNEGFLDIDVEDTAAYPYEDWLRMVFEHPLAYVPGSTRRYSDASTYLLSRLISQVCQENADALLYRRLLRPMGFREAAWSRCPLGYPVGATGLYLSAEDTVKLGALYLQQGVWNGQRLLSQEWVRLAIAREYEFYVMTPNGLIGKAGFFGQGLVFSWEQGFAAAWHTHTDRAGLNRITACVDAIRAKDLCD